jgi:hypothetical protein
MSLQARKRTFMKMGRPKTMAAAPRLRDGQLLGTELVQDGVSYGPPKSYSSFFIAVGCNVNVRL